MASEFSDCLYLFTLAVPLDRRNASKASGIPEILLDSRKQVQISHYDTIRKVMNASKDDKLAEIF